MFSCNTLQDYVNTVKSVVSTKPNAPAATFGSSQRTSLSPRPIGTDATVLPPEATSSIGKMVDSRKHTVPSHSFGTSQRYDALCGVASRACVRSVSLCSLRLFT